MRVAIVIVFVALVSLLTAPIWYMGGFATAEVDHTAPRGEPIEHDLFTITPHSAEITTGDDEDLLSSGPQLLIRAELASHEQEPERASTIGRLFDVELQPAGIEPENSFDFSLELERRPGQRVTWVQPGTTEDVALIWGLPEEFGSISGVEGVEQVRMTVYEAELAGGFVDETERWDRTFTEDIEAEVLLPLGEG